MHQARTLVVEAVDAVDRSTLVVPAQQVDVVRVLDLERQQQANGLQRLNGISHRTYISIPSAVTLFPIINKIALNTRVNSRNRHRHGRRQCDSDWRACVLGTCLPRST